MENAALLAVGATGMLRAALDELASEADRTCVVARQATAAHAAQPVPGRSVATVDMDWNEPAAALAALSPELTNGFGRALLWIHSSASEFWEELLKDLVKRPMLVLQVLGNRGEPEQLKSRVRDLAPVDGFRYVRVKLGAKRVEGEWRWLTHEEISQGAVVAMRQERDVDVGVPRPAG